MEIATAGADAGEPGAHRRIPDVLPEAAQLAVVLLWSSTFILTKDAYDDIRPLAFVFARFVLITALALGVLAVRGWRGDREDWWQVDRADLPRFAAAGLFGYTIYQLGFTLGLEHTSPFSSSLLISMVPLFSLVIVTVRGERSPLLVWVGVITSLLGVGIFLSGAEGGGTWLGNGLSVMAAVSFAMYGVVNRPLVRRYRPETVAAYTTVAGAVPLFLIAAPAASRQDWESVPVDTWLVILYMAILPVYVAYMLWNWAIRKRGVTATSWALLVPVVSGILSATFYGEPFGPAKVIGGALALLGLALMRPRTS
jgi:drug/metabolite transporter (DMT)-like permease